MSDKFTAIKPYSMGASFGVYPTVKSGFIRVVREGDGTVITLRLVKLVNEEAAVPDSPQPGFRYETWTEALERVQKGG